MFFICMSTILLFGLLTGYFVIQGLWLYATLSGILFLASLIWTIEHYRRRKKKKKLDDDYDPLFWDCLFIPGYPSSGGKGSDCDGDCDFTPDCSP